MSTPSLHFSPPRHTVSDYLLPCHLQFFGLYLFPGPLLFALCLQHAHSLTLTSARFPPHTASVKRCPAAGPIAALVTLGRSTVVLLTPAPEQGRQAARVWRGEETLQNDTFSINVAVARNELELPVAVVGAGWVSLIRDCMIPESTQRQGERTAAGIEQESRVAQFCAFPSPLAHTADSICLRLAYP